MPRMRMAYNFSIVCWLSMFLLIGLVKDLSADRFRMGYRSNRRHECFRAPGIAARVHCRAPATGPAGCGGWTPYSGSCKRGPAGRAGPPLPCARRDRFSPDAEFPDTTGIPSPDGALSPESLAPVG